jgi:hypothetical protein
MQTEQNIRLMSAEIPQLWTSYMTFKKTFFPSFLLVSGKIAVMHTAMGKIQSLQEKLTNIISLNAFRIQPIFLENPTFLPNYFNKINMNDNRTLW